MSHGSSENSTDPPASGVRLGRRCMLAALCGAAAVGAVGVWAAGEYRRNKRFAAHDEGKVYRSPWLPAESFQALIAEHKIRTVVNLCSGDELCDRLPQQTAAAEAAGAQVVNLAFPLNNTWHVDDPAVRQAEALLDDESCYPIWVHCWHGRERTVKLLAMYDIRRRGMTAEASLKRMPLFGVDHPWPIVAFAYDYEVHVYGEQASRGSHAHTAVASKPP